LKKGTLPKLLTGISLAALITAGSLPLMAQEKTTTSCSANMKMTKTEAKKAPAKKTTAKAKTAKAKAKTAAAPAADTTKK
jgi:hypothetical protein